MGSIRGTRGGGDYVRRFSESDISSKGRKSSSIDQLSDGELAGFKVQLGDRIQMCQKGLRNSSVQLASQKGKERLQQMTEDLKKLERFNNDLWNPHVQEKTKEHKDAEETTRLYEKLLKNLEFNHEVEKISTGEYKQMGGIIQEVSNQLVILSEYENDYVDNIRYGTLQLSLK